MKHFDEERMIAEDQKVKDTYHKKGYLKSKQDEQDLHMAFSPYKVPKGLTKLQIRRKINKFVRNGRKADNPLFGIDENGMMFSKMNRIEIHINGKLCIGASFTGKVPDSGPSYRKLLREII